MRLIDAEALIDRINNGTYLFAVHGTPYPMVGTDEIIKEIQSAPTIEAKPVVHAHWKGCEDPRNAFCTHCGLVIEKQTAPVYRYCRACGAQMDEEVSE